MRLDLWGRMVPNNGSMSVFTPSSSVLALLLSFALTLGFLIVGSRLIVDLFNLFPGDNTGELTLANILHDAWGSSKNRSISEQTSSMDTAVEFLLPIALTAFFGISAIVAFFVFGKEKSIYYLAITLLFIIDTL